MTAFEDFVDAVEKTTGSKGRRHGAETRLPCPVLAHDDHHPSLDVRESDDGRPLATCRSRGCSFEAMCEAIGREPREFQPTSRNGRVPDVYDAWCPHNARAVAVYHYVDEHGKLVQRVSRTADKEFPQSWPDPTSKSGWRWKAPADFKRVLYHLDEVAKAVDEGARIWLAEGEKCVDALRKHGVIATCNPGGAKKWWPELTEQIAGAYIVTLVADNDRDGELHAIRVRDELASKVAEFRIVRAKAGKDAYDHLEAGYSLDDFVPFEPGQAGSETVTLADVVATFRRWLNLPDPGALYAMLAAVAANRLEGDPVWIVLVGPSGGGKTELLGSLGALDDVHPAATITEAALLSGTARKEQAPGAKGGLLRELGDFGILVLKDFGSVLSMHREDRARTLAALREIHDGEWTRRLGVDGGRMIKWTGKLGLIAGCVPTLDQHYAVMATLGERFLLYRLTIDEPAEHARRSLAHVGGARKMRAELRDAVRALLGGLDLRSAENAFGETDVTRLVALSELVVKARSPVVRDSYASREIEFVPDAEAPGRLVVELGQLLLGLRAIGLDDTAAWPVLVKVGKDSMPALRRQALELLVRAPGSLTTTEISTALDLPTSTTRRTLEDLTAHGVLSRHSPGSPHPDTWSATDETRRLYAAANDPEMSGVPVTITPSSSSDPTKDDISGLFREPA